MNDLQFQKQILELEFNNLSMQLIEAIQEQDFVTAKKIQNRIQIIKLDLQCGDTEDINYKIRHLELQISGYHIEYDYATAAEKNDLRVFINSARSSLDKLIDQQKLNQSAEHYPEIMKDVEKVEDSKTFLQTTESQQFNGSSFWLSEFGGFGSLPTYTEFDPTYWKEFSLAKLFIPTQDEVNTATSLVLSIEKMKFQLWNETETNGIQHQFLKFCKRQSFKVFVNKTSLKQRNITGGIITDGSAEDAHVKRGEFYLAVYELKGPDTCIFANVAQAAAYGTSFAMTLLKNGISREDCVVPVI